MKENSAEGTVVGILSAVDPDNTAEPRQTLTFTLTDDGKGRFCIVNNELQVRWIAEVYLTLTSFCALKNITSPCMFVNNSGLVWFGLLWFNVTFSNFSAI